MHGEKEEMEMKLTDSLPGTNRNKFQVTQWILMTKAPIGLWYYGERERERFLLAYIISDIYQIGPLIIYVVNFKTPKKFYQKSKMHYNKHNERRFYATD